MIGLATLNALDRDGFVQALAGIFEHSPWIPAAAFDARPFASAEALHRAMADIVQTAPRARKLALLTAHPELAAKSDRKAPLTAESTAEQAGAGLDTLAVDEAARLAAANRLYRQRFGFPFIIAVRGQRDRAAILNALETRTHNSEDQEIDTAIAEVAKIAWFRLGDLIEGYAPMDKPTQGGRLTTHVLDMRLGQPARGLAFELFSLADGARTSLCAGRTNDDGRAPAPLLEGAALVAGLYELVFAVGAYQAGQSETGFYDDIPIRFRVVDTDVHYHVPLLLSPYGYSTYRGS